MLQKDELLEWRTIYQNVLLGLEIQHALTARSRALARALLTQYGLNAFANAKPSELSGGMRQRAAPVSYTHLDVYKRQPLILPSKALWRLFSDR